MIAGSCQLLVPKPSFDRAYIVDGGGSGGGKVIMKKQMMDGDKQLK